MVCAVPRIPREQPVTRTGFRHDGDCRLGGIPWVVSIHVIYFTRSIPLRPISCAGFTNTTLQGGQMNRSSIQWLRIKMDTSPCLPDLV